MNQEIHDKYHTLKLCTEMMIPAIALWEETKGDFDSKAKLYSDGTMDVILPHFMSIQDMKKSTENLSKALRISRLLAELKKELFNDTASDKTELDKQSAK